MRVILQPRFHFLLSVLVAAPGCGSNGSTGDPNGAMSASGGAPGGGGSSGATNRGGRPGGNGGSGGSGGVTPTGGAGGDATAAGGAATGGSGSAQDPDGGSLDTDVFPSLGSPWAVAPSASSSRAFASWMSRIAAGGVTWVRGFDGSKTDAVVAAAGTSGLGLSGILMFSKDSSLSIPVHGRVGTASTPTPRSPASTASRASP